VIGSGSIGSRHATVLSELGNEVATVTARTDLDRLTYKDLAQGLAQFDPSYVVVANETSKHAISVQELSELNYDGALLIEKPLAVPPDLVNSAQFSRVGVGFNLRFHPVILRLAHLLAGTEIFTVEAYAGQNLASWRPGRTLESQYSMSKDRGGGVLRDLSHELDYLGWLCGPCTGVFARGGKVSSVTRDSDDAWGIVAQYSRATVVTLQLNYLDTQKRRRLVINSSIGTIEADLIASSVRVNDSLERYPNDANTTYRAMHEAMLSGTDSPLATVTDAIATDQLIAMIEESVSTGIWVEQR
jgi:predicted dehydrogenase